MTNPKHALRWCVYVPVFFFLFDNDVLAQKLSAANLCLVDSARLEIRNASILLKSGPTDKIINFWISTGKQCTAVSFNAEPDLFFEITSVGYLKKLIPAAEIKPGDNFIALERNYSSVDEVIVRNQPKIIVGTDTIRFNPQYYTDGTEEKLDDLLKKLPGFNVDKNSGDIFFQGKQISKILIDNANLVDHDYKVVSNNLDAQVVSTIEMILNYSDNPILSGWQGMRETVINVKTRNRESFDGSITATGGENNSYKLEYNGLRIADKLKFYQFLNLNNLGRTSQRATSFVKNNFLSDLSPYVSMSPVSIFPVNYLYNPVLDGRDILNRSRSFGSYVNYRYKEWESRLTISNNNDRVSNWTSNEIIFQDEASGTKQDYLNRQTINKDLWQSTANIKLFHLPKLFLEYNASLGFGKNREGRNSDISDIITTTAQIKNRLNNFAQQADLTIQLSTNQIIQFKILQLANNTKTNTDQSFQPFVDMNDIRSINKSVGFHPQILDLKQASVSWHLRRKSIQFYQSISYNYKKEDLKVGKEYYLDNNQKETVSEQSAYKSRLALSRSRLITNWKGIRLIGQLDLSRNDLNEFGSTVDINPLISLERKTLKKNLEAGYQRLTNPIQLFDFITPAIQTSFFDLFSNSMYQRSSFSNILFLRYSYLNPRSSWAFYLNSQLEKRGRVKMYEYNYNYPFFLRFSNLTAKADLASTSITADKYLKQFKTNVQMEAGYRLYKVPAVVNGSNYERASKDLNFGLKINSISKKLIDFRIDNDLIYGKINLKKDNKTVSQYYLLYNGMFDLLLNPTKKLKTIFQSQYVATTSKGSSANTLLFDLKNNYVLNDKLSFSLEMLNMLNSKEFMQVFNQPYYQSVTKTPLRGRTLLAGASWKF